MEKGIKRLDYKSGLSSKKAGTVEVIEVNYKENPEWIEDHSKAQTHKIITKSAKIGTVKFIINAKGASEAIREQDLRGHETWTTDGTLKSKMEWFETMKSRYDIISEYIK